MNSKLTELLSKCRKNSEKAQRLLLAQEYITEARTSQFEYSQLEMNKFLKEVSPFPKSLLTKICNEFHQNQEYFSADVVKDFLKSFKKKILQAGQKDCQYLDSLECVFVSGSSIVYSNERECTAKEFCVEFVDTATHKSFSILFPVAENFYFRSESDISDIYSGVFKLYNLGLSYSEAEREMFKHDNYHPCICSTLEVEELASTLKTFLTTKELDTHDINATSLLSAFNKSARGINEEVCYFTYDPYDMTNHSLSMSQWEYYSQESKRDRETRMVLNESSIESLLKHMDEASTDVKYKKIKVKN